MSISSIAAQFCARRPAVNPASIDDEIKVYAATLEAFNSKGQLRSLVDNATVDAETISQAKEIVNHLGELTQTQKMEVLTQLKDMANAAESQIMGKLISASANSSATSIEDLVDAANRPEPAPEAPAMKASTTSIQVNGLADVGSMLTALLGLGAKAPAAPVTVGGIDVNKVKGIVDNPAGVDYADLRAAFNI